MGSKLLKWAYIGAFLGEYLGLIKGDTRSLDYTSHGKGRIGFRVRGGGLGLRMGLQIEIGVEAGATQDYVVLSRGTP